MSIGNVNSASSFDNWANSAENYNKSISNEEVEDFSMFEDFDLGSYSSDLNEFSQDYIDLYDEDKDGSWNYEEFAEMALGGTADLDTIQSQADLYNGLKTYYQDSVIAQYDDDGNGTLSEAEFYEAIGVSTDGLSNSELESLRETFTAFNVDEDGDAAELSAEEILLAANPDYIGALTELKTSSEINDLLETSFNDLNINDEDQVIDSQEYASFLYTADLDWDIYGETGSAASSVDGVLDYNQFNSTSSIDPSSEYGQDLRNERIDFYNYYYNSSATV